MSMVILSKKEASNVCGGFNLRQELRNAGRGTNNVVREVQKGLKQVNKEIDNALTGLFNKEKEKEIAAYSCPEQKVIVETCFDRCVPYFSNSNPEDGEFYICYKLCRAESKESK